MVELTTIMVVLAFWGAIYCFTESFYRIATEEDYHISWKIEAITSIISGIMWMLLLFWMHMEGWW